MTGCTIYIFNLRRGIFGMVQHVRVVAMVSSPVAMMVPMGHPESYGCAIAVDLCPPSQGGAGQRGS